MKGEIMKASSKKESFFLKKFISILNEVNIGLEIIDTSGRQYRTDQAQITHQLVVNDSKFINALLSPNAFTLGEAYIKGYFDISGSIKDLYEKVCSKILETDQRKSLVSFFTRFFSNIRQKEKENVEYHYNMPSEFYRTFLGKTMGYTCGYYTHNNASMDDAQNEKMDVICRKLRLEEDEELLDIGCGWGNFAVYAAKHYDVKVTGITLSSEQKKYADEWARQEGLSDRIRIKIMNYRDLGSQMFHKISCIGMSEHVGKDSMSTFFRKVYESLKTGGLFMQHTITTNVARKKGYENTFLNKYMFPGGELMFEHNLVDLATSQGFELLNAENFRPHYARTLDDWIHRMEKHRDRLLKIVNENVYRIYHVFFIGSLVSFQTKEISLFQNLFYKTDSKNCTENTFITPYSKNEKRFA